MTDVQLQDQINQVNQKLDLILESVELQKRSREELDDLVQDAGIVVKDVFHQSVTILEKAEVDLDHNGIPMLLIKVLQNIDTFREMLEMLESARDFMKDVSPILHQAGLDAVNKMHELEQKGYIEYAGELLSFMERFTRAFTVDDLRNLGNNLDQMMGIVRNATHPDVIAALNRATRALAETSRDDKIDNKSLFGLLREMNSPDVRKSLAYALRLLKAVNRE